MTGKRGAQPVGPTGLAGGIADKLGNRYEGRWTIACLALLLSDDWEFIQLEPYDGYKIEFSGRRRDGVVEHHQAKRSAPGGGNWSRGKLEREGLLAAMGRWSGPGHEFLLISASPIDPDVGSLATQARMAPDMVSFLSGLSAERAADLRGFQNQLAGISDDGAWELLRRVSFRQMDDETAKELGQARLAGLVDGEPTEAAAHLADYLEEHIGERIRSTGLWRFLGTRGVHRRDWGSDPDLRSSIEHQVQRFVGDPGEASILGLQDPRRETSEVVELLTADDSPSVVVLSAAAGMGKSVITKQIVERLSTNLLTLPLRLDALPAVATADDVGRHLGLRGSPVQVLAHLAAGDRAVLVIDQLDAVSEVSGRYGMGFEAIAEMLSELTAHPNIRLLLACREFDLEVDRRLRRIRDREGSRVVRIAMLDDDFIDSVLRAASIPMDALSPAQREIVRVPLHLRLLAEAAGGRPMFTTDLDLFDAYWDAKRRSVGRRGGDEAEAAALIDELATEMSRRQQLEVPADVASRRPVELQLLESDHVLTPSGRSVRFFHERFFDYAFARAFARRGDSLATFLTSTTQGLFRRSQARQILSYRRMADRTTYLRDLRETLLHASIRFHLKTLILAWLRTLPDPDGEEWQILSDLVQRGDDRLIGHAMSVLSGSPRMFDRADAMGTFSTWLHSGDETVRDRAVLVLTSAQRLRAERVASLLGELDRSTERNRERLVYAIRHADLAVDQSFFEFFLGLVAAGCLDDLRRVFAMNDSFWDLSHGLVKTRPEWAARFVRTYLERRIHLASELGVGNPFDDPESIPHPLERDIFTKIASAAPATYAAEILPLVLGLIDSNKIWNDEERRFDDRIWRWRMFGETYGVADGLLTALEVALRRMAEAREDFTSHRAALEAAVSSTADHVLARAFAAAPEWFAADAADWLIANPARFAAGYMDASYWVGRELVEAIWPHLDTGRRESLELVILNYYPAWERSREGHRQHGWAQHTIITAIPEDALSAAGRRRSAELRRKFGREPSPPRGIEVGWVGSPVPAEAVPKMTDAQWLSALSEYAKVDDNRLAHRPTSRAGGAMQLGRQLQEETKRAPTRFARLGMTLPDELAVVYGEQILLGLRETEAPPSELVFNLVRRLHSLTGRPCGRFLGDAVASVSAVAPVPDDIIEIIAWYSLNDPDPPSGHSTTDHARDNPVRLGLVDDGINTVRGSTAHAIAKILKSELQPLDAWRDVISAMTRDDSDAVRSCVAGVLLVCLGRDRDWVIQCVLELIDGRDNVATSVDAEQVIRLGVRSHPEKLLPVAARLVASEDEAVARVGARIACVAALSIDEARPLAERALIGNAGARLGAAEIYAATIGVDAYRASSRAALIPLFDDPDSTVRREAGTCFQALQGKALVGEEELFLAYAATSSITDNPHDVLDALLEAPSLPPEATIAVCKAVVAAAGVEAGSFASAWSAQMPDVATLAARLHAHSDERISEAGLDLIDSLTISGAYGLDPAIAPFER